jgi:hypothetical protein
MRVPAAVSISESTTAPAVPGSAEEGAEGEESSVSRLPLLHKNPVGAVRIIKTIMVIRNMVICLYVW